MGQKPDFTGYCKRLRTFKQYRDLSEEVFNRLAQDLYDKKYQNIQEQGTIVKNDIGTWLNEAEASEAQGIFNSYVQNNNITNFSDIALLKILVTCEMQQKRIQNQITETMANTKIGDRGSISSSLLKSYNEINEQILNLKKTLGLSEDRKVNDPLEKFNQLVKKFQIWRNEKGNHAYRYRVCPSCGKELALVIRLEYYDVLKNPWYKNKILCNDYLWQLYQEGKITKMDIAKILFGENVNTTLYVDWLERKLYNKDGQELKESED